jgi:peptidoglycan/LPS O-acetylase OafA/YrhL
MDAMKDDRVLLTTRVIAIAVTIVLALAFLALYVAPDHTDVNFAWTILPRTSALLIGAGYTAGAYFFIRLVTDGKWHRVQAGFLPITSFTVVMLAATILHWGRFHQGTAPFIMWAVIYAITPLVVPFVWWRNRRTEATGLEPHDTMFSARTRMALRVIAVLGLLAFLIVFIRPSILISLAAWKLTELTARIFAGWSILTFATLLSIANDGRWSATRVLMESSMVALVLTLLAVPRMWSDFNKSSPMTYAFVGGIVLTLVVFIVLHVRLDAASRKA